ncbi:uncharacterized protein MELLADRAFT_88709 [Melampsora larici-populina 98AG31]|uniref:Uncharacterized protein n=1 Tax=Melampsora larici-populina (strain 98AG31 / pathotype 3-4-7) TaxID=747676 RepID=F4RSQ4_MELLP|nr:uncharacterized protein MELLADRAFT_88709 [Melampsora larici-populina 98AG31]EGG04655.1 hypothetical protein MELLADRAFT_88709 [Melampsora larici-populina 98AG31]
MTAMISLSSGGESPITGYVPFLPLDLVLDLKLELFGIFFLKSTTVVSMQAPTTSNTPSSLMLPPTPISTLPDPNPMVTEPFEHHKQLDNLVKEFAPHQGYAIIVGHSGRDPYLYCKYDCHCGGKPAKSIKIGCPFKMKATFHKERHTWTLHHQNTYHNHGPMEMEIPDITSRIAPTSAEQTLDLDPSHKPTNVLLDTSLQSQLLSISNRILSMTASQEDEIIQSIHKLLDAVCNVPEDKIPTNLPDPHQDAAIQLLDDLEQFNKLIQFQSPLHVKDNITSIMYRQEPEKSPTWPSSIDIDAFNITVMNDQPLMNDQPSFDSIDSFLLEDLLQLSLQPSVQTNCQVLDATPEIDVNSAAKHHEPSSHDHARNIDQEASVPSTLPSSSFNKVPIPPHPVCDTLQVPIPQARTTRSTIKKTASVSPRRTRSKVYLVTGVAAQSGVKRTQISRTCSTPSAKKHK